MASMKDKMQKVVDERGKAHKIYVGDAQKAELARDFTSGEVVINTDRYKGRIVMKYGKHLEEIKPDTSKKKTTEEKE
jgi:hypothetical protein